jgi:hypothetical protein
LKFESFHPPETISSMSEFDRHGRGERATNDMVGMYEFGPIVRDENEPLWHGPWGARMFAVGSALGAWRRWPIDASWAQIESMPPEEYLRSACYEKRLPATIANAVRHGLITREEVETAVRSHNMGRSPFNPGQTSQLATDGAADASARRWSVR